MTKIYPIRGRRSVIFTAAKSHGIVFGFGVNKSRTDYIALHDYLIMYTFVFNFAIWYIRIDLSRFYKNESSF